MPWASPEQIAFLNSRAQEFQDSINRKDARDWFWASLRKDWMAQWELEAKQKSRLSTHFRNEMQRRGVFPKRVYKSKKRQPKPQESVRAPLAQTSRHQVPEVDNRELTVSSTRAVEDLLLTSFSPSLGPASRSPMPGPSNIIHQLPTPLRLPSRGPASHSPTPGPSHAHHRSPPPAQPRCQSGTPALSCSLPPPALSHPSPTPSPSSLSLEGKLSTMATVPPMSIWVKEVSKTLAFHLELPGVVKDDVELVVQGQRLAVHARSNNVAYKWSTDVGAPVKSKHVQCGLVDGALRILVKIMAMEKETDEREISSHGRSAPFRHSFDTFITTYLTRNLSLTLHRCLLSESSCT